MAERKPQFKPEMLFEYYRKHFFPYRCDAHAMLAAIGQRALAEDPRVPTVMQLVYQNLLDNGRIVAHMMQKLLHTLPSATFHTFSEAKEVLMVQQVVTVREKARITAETARAAQKEVQKAADNVHAAGKNAQQNGPDAQGSVENSLRIMYIRKEQTVKLLLRALDALEDWVVRFDETIHTMTEAAMQHNPNRLPWPAMTMKKENPLLRRELDNKVRARAVNIFSQTMCATMQCVFPQEEVQHYHHAARVVEVLLQAARETYPNMPPASGGEGEGDCDGSVWDICQFLEHKSGMYLLAIVKMSGRMRLSELVHLFGASNTEDSSSSEESVAERARMAALSAARTEDDGVFLSNLSHWTQAASIPLNFECSTEVPVPLEAGRRLIATGLFSMAYNERQLTMTLQRVRQRVRNRVTRFSELVREINIPMEHQLLRSLDFAALQQMLLATDFVDNIDLLLMQN